MKKQTGLLCLLFAVLVLVASCAEFIDELPSRIQVTGEPRLLFYIHSTSSSPVDIDFTVMELAVKNSSGVWITALDEPVTLRSVSLSNSQRLLGEAFVPEGLYSELRMTVSAASIRSGVSRASLSVADQGVLEPNSIELNLTTGQSTVVTLAWNPNESIEKRVLFNPDIKVDPQRSSARELIMFVSNSGSDYVSVLDMSLERVTAAVSVGSRPMGMTLNATGDTLYVVNSASRTISVVDPIHFEQRDLIDIAGGIEPTDVVFVPDGEDSIEGKLYVTNRMSNDIAVISTYTRRLLKMLQVGLAPSHIVANPERKEVYVTNEFSNTVSIISTVDDTVTANLRVNGPPVGLALNSDDNMLYVFIEASNSVAVLSTIDRVLVETIALEQGPARGVVGFDNRLFVGSSSSDTMTFLTRDNVIIRTIDSGADPSGFSVDEIRNRLYVTNTGDDTVSVVDPLGHRIVKDLQVGKGPYGIVQMER